MNIGDIVLEELKNLISSIPKRLKNYDFSK
jgi:hypothetical protein